MSVPGRVMMISVAVELDMKIAVTENLSQTKGAQPEVERPFWNSACDGEAEVRPKRDVL